MDKQTSPFKSPLAKFVSMSSTSLAICLSMTSLILFACGDSDGGTANASEDQGNRRLPEMDALMVAAPPLIGMDQGIPGQDGGAQHTPGNHQMDLCQIDALRCGPSGERQRCAYNPDTQRAEWSSEGFCSVGEVCMDGRCQGGSGAPCDDLCSAGSARCAGDLIQFCATGAEGCMVWMQPLECEDNGLCMNGACSQADGCRNNCFQGQVQCVGQEARRCQQDGDGCWIWGAPERCADDERCERGACVSVSGCTSECIPDQNRCAGELIQSCIEVESGCFRFDDPQQCPEGDVCRFQECSCRDECVLGQIDCADNGVRRCLFQDRCAQWSPITPCDAGRVCQNGQCLREPCNHECIAAGQRECQGDQIRVCQQDANLCRSWGPAENCEPGRICQDGGCVPDCENECDFVGTTRCETPQQVQQCLRDAQTQCTEWVDFFECAQGQTCDEGRCIFEN